MSTIYDKKLKMKLWRIPVGIPGISKVPIYGIYVKKTVSNLLDGVQMQRNIL